MVFRHVTYLGYTPSMASTIKGGGEKGSKKDGVGGGLVCAHCKKAGELDTLKRCGRCRRVCYCSVECQKLHWGKGGHKKVCGREGEGRSGDRSDGVPGAPGGGGAPLKHPCPICLDNEDDFGLECMCFSCGQLFCGSCKESLAQRGLANCPTCRSVLLDLPAKEVARLVRLLLARSDGRHTPLAQFTLGALYADGAGVAQNQEEAVRWYRLAAHQGNADAQFNIGGCYHTGTGVVQDVAEASRWYRLAADQGHARAEFTLGECYRSGTGVAPDFAEAVRWYRLAGDQGHANAQSNLGISYEQGNGVAQDSAEAVRWNRLAADQGNAPAQYNLGVHYARGSGVASDSAEAVRWYRLAGDQGHADAQFILAMCYGKGTGVAQDTAEAMRWVRLAADQGHAGAQTVFA
jgi:TPR repeat protein